MIQDLGSNLMFVSPGKIDTTDISSMKTSSSTSMSGDILTLDDVEAIKKVEGVSEVSPMSLVPASVSFGDKMINAVVTGVYPNFGEALQIVNIEQGDMFSESSSGYVTIIGSLIKTEAFGEENALGKSININDIPFTIVGVFEEMDASSYNSDQFNSFIIIPFDTSTELNQGIVSVNEITIQAEPGTIVNDVKELVTKALLDSHDGKDNFSVLTQEDILELSDQFLSLATSLVSAIAAISLMVGGIGIMNIMLVTVTERTKEIGLRKAVGATKVDIAIQFLVEAIIVTLLGGLIGLGFSFGVGLIVSSQTPLTPSTTPQVILLAIGISTIVGVTFGLWPALKAANKDPIEALRYE